MSKIANDGLTRSGTGCFIGCTHMATVGIKGFGNVSDPAARSRVGHCVAWLGTQKRESDTHTRVSTDEPSSRLSPPCVHQHRRESTRVTSDTHVTDVTADRHLHPIRPSGRPKPN